MQQKKQEKSKEQGSPGKRLAIIRIRGMANVPAKINHVLDLMKLRKKHVCVVVDDTPSIKGMINIIKDYVAWGEVDEETFKLLVEKRGQKDPEDNSKLKPFFRLCPPRKGFERKGIKRTFTEGGALGYRGSKMNDLLKRMI